MHKGLMSRMVKTKDEMDKKPAETHTNDKGAQQPAPVVQQPGQQSRVESPDQRGKQQQIATQQEGNKKWSRYKRKDEPTALELEIQKAKKRKQREQKHRKLDVRQNIDKMGALLTHANTTTRPMFYQDLNAIKRLEFTHQTIFTYTKHQKVASQVMLNKNTRCFTSFNDKELVVWNPLTEETLFKYLYCENAGLKQITCLCYSESCFLYFAFTRSKKLCVFNEYLNLVKTIKLKIRTVQKCFFVDSTKQLITAGVEGCHLIQMNIQFMYSARRSIKLDPKGENCEVDIDSYAHLSDFDGYLEFQGVSDYKLYEYSGDEKIKEKDVRGMSLDEKQNFFVIWGEKKACFYDFQPFNISHTLVKTKEVDVMVEREKEARRIINAQMAEQKSKSLKPIVDYSDLTDADDFITNIKYISSLHYLVVSTTMGCIQIYKWDKKTKQKDFQHSFKSHTKAIASLNTCQFSDTYIVTASLDGLIKIWCLDKMIEIYTFEVWSQADGGIGDAMDKIEMIDDKIYAIFLKGHSNAIQIGQISHLASSFFISKPLIEQVTKGFSGWSQITKGEPDSIIVSFDNNSILILDAKTGNVKSTVYPPPTPTIIKTILYQMSLSRLILMLHNGAICMYKVYQRETATLEFMQEAKHLVDADEKTLSGCEISCIMLTNIIPPHADCELFSEGPRNPRRRSRINRNKQFEGVEGRCPSPQSEELNYEDNEENAVSDCNDNFLVCGLKKGQVIFIRLDMTNYVYGRFAVHRQEVKHIEQIRERKVFLSICLEYMLHIWGFNGANKFERYSTYVMCRPVDAIKVLKDNVLLVWPNGESTYLCYEPEQKVLSLLPQDKDRDHDYPITAIDFSAKSNLHVTCDSDGLIKVWNEMREIIREIKFNDPDMSSVTFCCTQVANPNSQIEDLAQDLLVGHGGKLSRILAKDYFGQKRSAVEVEPERLKEFYQQKRLLTNQDFEDWKNGKFTDYDEFDELLAHKQKSIQQTAQLASLQQAKLAGKTKGANSTTQPKNNDFNEAVFQNALQNAVKDMKQASIQNQATGVSDPAPHAVANAMPEQQAHKTQSKFPAINHQHHHQQPRKIMTSADQSPLTEMHDQGDYQHLPHLDSAATEEDQTGGQKIDLAYLREQVGRAFAIPHPLNTKPFGQLKYEMMQMQPKNRQQLTQQKICETIKEFNVANKASIYPQLMVSGGHIHQSVCCSEHGQPQSVLGQGSGQKGKYSKQREELLDSIQEQQHENNLANVNSAKYSKNRIGIVGVSVVEGHQQRVDPGVLSTNQTVLLPNQQISNQLSISQQNTGKNQFRHPRDELTNYHSQPNHVFEKQRQNVLIQSSSVGDLSPRSQTNANSQYIGENDTQQPQLVTQVIRASITQVDHNAVQQQKQQQVQEDQGGFEPISSVKDFRNKRQFLVSAGGNRMRTGGGQQQSNHMLTNKGGFHPITASLVKTDTLETGATSQYFTGPQRIQTAKIRHRKQQDSQRLIEHRIQNRKQRMQSHRVAPAIQENPQRCSSNQHNTPKQYLYLQKKNERQERELMNYQTEVGSSGPIMIGKQVSASASMAALGNKQQHAKTNRPVSFNFAQQRAAIKENSKYKAPQPLQQQEESQRQINLIAVSSTSAAGLSHLQISKPGYQAAKQTTRGEGSTIHRSIEVSSGHGLHNPN